MSTETDSAVASASVIGSGTGTSANEQGASLAARWVAECIGTYLLVLLGCGAVHAAVLAEAQSGIWQIAAVWAIAIILACYSVGAVSGAHINPAITIALAVWRKFSWWMVVPYITAQLVGAFLAAVTLFGLFHPFLAEKEEAKGIVRGGPGSEITAMCYGEYFPSPGPIAGDPARYLPEAHTKLNLRVSERTAFLAEALGTLILAFVVLAVTDERNRSAPPPGLAPVAIGLTVAALISFIAPLTQACFNPARDFGPRLFAYLAGWGPIALPGARGTGFLTVYILAPTIGAVIGAGLYRILGRLRAGDPEVD